MKFIFKLTILVLLPSLAFPAWETRADDAGAGEEELARFTSVTEAVAANPESAPDIVTSLCSSFPQSAAGIVLSALDGMPEVTEDALVAVIEAAVQAAPEQEDVIRSAVARSLESEDVAQKGETIDAAVARWLENGVRGDEEAAVLEPAEVSASGEEPVDEAVGDVPDEVREAEITVGDDAARSEDVEEMVEEKTVAEPEVAATEETSEESVDEAGERELPERLEREKALMLSLMATFPDRVSATVRRSVSRVADEEAFWSAELVKAALAEDPEREEEVLSESLAAAPRHEDAILRAAGREVDEEEITEVSADEETGDVPVEEESEEPVEELADDDREDLIPERLERELAMLESLLGMFPERAVPTVRRSVGRVSDEEAFWTLAIVETAVARVPDRRASVAEAAVEAAPHHEETILGLLDELGEHEPEEMVAPETDEDMAAEPFRLARANEVPELDGDHYSVRLELPVSEPSRVRVAVHSLELRIQPERHFDPLKGRFLDRDMAIVTGDGIVGLVFKINPQDAAQLESLSGVLERFTRKVTGATAFVSARRADDEHGLLLTEIREEIAPVYFYPGKKDVPAEFAGDFRDETYGFVIGGSVSLTPDTVPAVRHLIENLSRYMEERDERMRARERQRDEFYEFTRKTAEDEADEDKEES